MTLLVTMLNEQIAAAKAEIAALRADAARQAVALETLLAVRDDGRIRSWATGADERQDVHITLHEDEWEIVGRWLAAAAGDTPEEPTT